MTSTSDLRVYTGEALSKYHFGEGHPFGPKRYPAFLEEFQRRGLSARVQPGNPASADRGVIELFHDPAYVRFVQRVSRTGDGLLDYGDTPAFPGVYEASATVAGTVISGVDAVMAGDCRRAFVPIAGLHHARRNRAGGFCVFNDCGIAIEYLRAKHGVGRIAYVDIDAHHGDGVYYGFEDDPELFIADFHEDGRHLYPGTGSVKETGRGNAAGTKRNIPLLPSAGDEEFLTAWGPVEEFLERAGPDFVLLQCGADSLKDDPITHLALTTAAHVHAATRLRALAERHAGGRLVALGGGGYDTGNLARAWCDVIEALV